MPATATDLALPCVLPCVLMRAGTSRGPFFLRDWLPEGDEARDQALIGAIGASDLLQVDGVGGGSTLTSKVAIVSRSTQADCYVYYLFAQVGVGQQSVDTRPNCGNMLSGVGPFAIEQGLVQATEGQTRLRVFNVNTRSRIDVTVQTPGRCVAYEGTTGIDGVAGRAAAVQLDFLDAWGAVTGSVFPTGQRIDVNVSSAGNAKSLRRGTLLATALRGGSDLVLTRDVSACVLKVEVKGRRLVAETADEFIVEAGAGDRPGPQRGDQRGGQFPRVALERLGQAHRRGLGTAVGAGGVGHLLRLGDAHAARQPGVRQLPPLAGKLKR